MTVHTNDNISPHPETTQTKTADTEQPVAVPRTASRRGALTCAKMAPGMTLVAWAVLLLPFNWSGYVGLALSLIAVLLASIGLHAPKRFWHEISLTSLIAAAILCVVIIVFIALLLVVI